MMIVENFTHLNAHGHKVGDPRSRRAVGSQTEVPKVRIAADNSMAHVTGYQKYTVNASGVISGINGKYAHQERLLKRFKHEDHAATFADIGCNAGIMSLLARDVGYREVYALDHDPEYISVLTRVVQSVRIQSAGEVRAATFDFGDPLPQVDVTLCGALIHWVYCRTAHFANRMDLIFRYLFSATRKYLMIEWVDPSDVTVRYFKPKSNPDSCRVNISDPERGYSRAAFERNARLYSELWHTFAVTKTRTLYVFKKFASSPRQLAESTSPAPHLTCSTEGRLATTAPDAWAAILARQYILVELGDGSIVNFTAPQGKQGITSRVWTDPLQRYVLKVAHPRVAAMRREICVYRTLSRHGISWTPHMLCADNLYAMLMTHAGAQLTSANLPPDYEAQFETMLQDMKRIGLAHNDLKHGGPPRADGHGHWTYPHLELRVRDHRLIMFDFNMATINGSYSCRDQFGRNLEHPRHHTRLADANAMLALHRLRNHTTAGERMYR